MFSRFLVIVNELEALRKTYTEVEKVMKILRSLPKKWETKVTAIQEAKDLTKLSLEELIGSLMTYEIELYNHQRVEENKKSIAFMVLKNDDEEEESESESDEDSMEEECTNEDVNMCFMALEEHQDKMGIEPKMAQPVQPVEEPVDRLCSSGRGLVEGGQKVSLFPSGLFFPVKVILFLVEVRSRTDRGPAPAKHLMLRASQPIDP
ncbi:hypothetical protein CK203_064681 [Vitis vinifera]|uniref:UBN2 domain-containing protein n=1 Tax=Vitis vinifera TaxID=29760 RepID=A0A438G7Q1_VITVI|nr:hypothetical protein CK203_064681 [Vitis vinifera]